MQARAGVRGRGVCDVVRVRLDGRADPGAGVPGPPVAADPAAFEEAHAARAQGTGPFEAARTRLLHGAALRRAGQRVAAREQLDAAAATFGALGLDAWTARADGEPAASGRTARRGPRPGDPLTSQETRVVLLVARGLSDREIAAALFVSPKTVEHHVTSALRSARGRGQGRRPAARKTRS